MSTVPPNANPAATDEAAGRIAQLERQLSEANQRAASIERTHRINDLLREARAIDLDTARLLVERAMTNDATRDPAAVVAEIVAGKPFLFARDEPGAGVTAGQGAAHQRGAANSPPIAATRTGVLAPRPTDHVPAPLVEAADEARITGKRGDVLRYLRLRRAR